MKIESKPVTELEYGCEKCAFKSKNKRDTESHEMRSHLQKLKEQGGFFLILTQLRWEIEVNRHGCNVISGKWTGPGWYTFEFDNPPCPSGCCNDRRITSISLPEYVESLKEKIRESISDLRRFRGDKWKF